MSESNDFVLGRIEGKLDMLLTYRTEALQGDRRVNTRIEALEAWRWRTVGIATALGIISGWVSTILVK